MRDRVSRNLRLESVAVRRLPSFRDAQREVAGRGVRDIGDVVRWRDRWMDRTHSGMRALVSLVATAAIGCATAQGATPRSGGAAPAPRPGASRGASSEQEAVAQAEAQRRARTHYQLGVD